MPIDTNVTITPQNLVDYYKEFVVDVANANIAWGTNNEPFSEFDENNFGGTTAGRAINITGANVGSAGNLIDASDIYDAVIAETAQYLRIRNLRAILFVDGGGGNTGSRPTPGVIFDETRKAYLSTSYVLPPGTISTGTVTTGNDITATSLENLFNACRADFERVLTTTVTIQVNVCHASCHSSCHGSRGRR